MVNFVVGLMICVHVTEKLWFCWALVLTYACIFYSNRERDFDLEKVSAKLLFIVKYTTRTLAFSIPLGNEFFYVIACITLRQDF